MKGALYLLGICGILNMSCSKSDMPKPAPIIANNSATVTGHFTYTENGITTTDSLYNTLTGEDNGIEYSIVSYLPGRGDSIGVSVIFNSLPTKDSTYKAGGYIIANSVIIRTKMSDTLDSSIGTRYIMDQGQSFTVKTISATQYTITFNNATFTDSLTDTRTNKHYYSTLTASGTLNITDKEATL